MEGPTLIFPVVMCKPPISLWSPNSRLRRFLCVQVESVVCQCFPVYYPACQKNSGRDMRGIHSGELHPILFFFSIFFSSKRCFFSVKRLCVSTPFQCADTPTLRCWNWHKKNIVSARCCGTSELQKFNMKGAILCMLECIYWQHRHAVTHHLLYPKRWIMCKWANILCLLYTLAVFTLDHIVMFCFAAK